MISRSPDAVRRLLPEAPPERQLHGGPPWYSVRNGRGRLLSVFMRFENKTWPRLSKKSELFLAAPLTFAYIYDHTTLDVSKCVQDKFGFAIVDEADSVMIDEAETPHILSGSIHYTQKGESLYEKSLPNVKKIVEQVSMGLYSIDKLRKKATLTEKGKSWLANDCGDSTIFDDEFYDNKIKRIEKDAALTKAQKEGFVLAEKNSQLEQLKLQNVLCQLLTALTCMKGMLIASCQARGLS